MRNWSWRLSGSREFLWLKTTKILCNEEELDKEVVLTGKEAEVGLMGIFGDKIGVSPAPRQTQKTHPK